MSLTRHAFHNGTEAKRTQSERKLQRRNEEPELVPSAAVHALQQEDIP